MISLQTVQKTKIDQAIYNHRLKTKKSVIMVKPKKTASRDSEAQTNGIPDSNQKGGVFPGEKWLVKKIKQEFDVMVKQLEEDLQKKFEERIQSMKEEIEKLQANELVLLQSLQIAQQELRQVKSQSEREVAYLTKTLGAKQSVISQMTSTIDQIEQDKKLNNIRIVGIAESEGEDAIEKVLNTTNKLNLPDKIKANDIASACRMGKCNSGKSRDILVTFRHREKRDTVYQNKKSMPRDEVTPVFINEDLTLHRGKLFYQARLKKKAGKIYATWTQQGTVMVKTDIDARPCPVSTYPELKELICDGPTSSDSELSYIDEEWILDESSSVEY